MSETSETNGKEDSPADDPSIAAEAEKPAQEAVEAVEETAPVESEAAKAPAQTPPPAPPKQSRGLSWLALLIALAALAGSSYMYWQQMQSGRASAASQNSLQSMDKNVQATQTSLHDLERRIEALSEAQADSKRLAAELSKTIDQQSPVLDSLAIRTGSIEAAIAGMQGISTGSRNNWLLAEADYYMQIANAQLRLVGNPVNASLALQLADERLRDLGDPAYTDVRRALADEIQALEATSKIDIEGISLTLASLSRVVESLPIREQVERPENGSDKPTDENLSGLDRAGAAVRDALKSVVSVRRSDEQARPLISPDAKYFLRANLGLQLQAARLALLRGEKATFQHSLDDATAWLREYYARDNASVVGALQTLDEIRNQQFEAEFPDISESLRLLRQQRTLTGNAQ